VLALKIINFKDNAIAGDSLTWLRIVQSLTPRASVTTAAAVCRYEPPCASRGRSKHFPGLTGTPDCFNAMKVPTAPYLAKHVQQNLYDGLTKGKKCQS
jgi:hypothetical protein